MADFESVNEADLEPAAPPAGSPPATGDMGGFDTVKDSDLAPAAGGPAGPTGEFAYRGIPAAAASRFKAPNAMTNIFGNMISRGLQGYANTFTALTAKDQQDMIDAGYKPGDFKSVGGALRWGADVVTSAGLTTADAFLALGGGATEAAAGLGQQIGRETGADPALLEKEFGGAAETLLSDVGSMHSAALVDAARAQAKVGGVYSDAYRVDQTPGDGLTHTPLGKLPTEAESAGQAQVVAQALHLPESSAELINRTYLETGRPPAEVLMDAKTNADGVLTDIVSGKVPTAYEGPGRPMTPEELEGAKGAMVPLKGVETEAAVAGAPEAAVPPTEAPTALKGETNVPTEPGESRVGKSIAARALEAKLIDQMPEETAGYDTIAIKGLADRVAGLINDDPDKAIAIMRGDAGLPNDLRGPAQTQAFINGMELWMHENKRGDLAADLANSPLIKVSSEAGQTLRVARERAPDSPAAIFQDLKQNMEKAAGGKKQIRAARAVVKQAMPETEGVFLPKELTSIDNFLDSIKC